MPPQSLLINLVQRRSRLLIFFHMSNQTLIFSVHSPNSLIFSFCVSNLIPDVGCGPGTITCDFAFLAPAGHTIGLDYSSEVLSQAHSEAHSRSLSNISFQQGIASNLPFEDHSFDIVHCHAVLVHLPSASSIIAEMRRVCKPGGIVAAREPDWGTCAIHPHDERLEGWLRTHISLKLVQAAEPNTGRMLATWALAAGFEAENVELSFDVLEYSGAEQVKWWGELYARRMKTEEGRRAIEAGVATEAEVDGFQRAYWEWSEKGAEGAVWAMMHGRLVARK